MRYQFIQEESDQHDIKLLCKLMDVSRSGYYEFKTRQPTVNKITGLRLKEKIIHIFNESRRTYGYRRITAYLLGNNEKCSSYKIAKLMQQLQLTPLRKRRFKLTTDSKHTYPIFTNILSREFNPSKINQAWTSDITYLETTEGWLYLAVVMDLYSRAIIGWAMNKTMSASLVSDALKMALSRRKITTGLLLHSDRGSQYASFEYQALLKKHGIICSMSRKGNCWDNAPMESFFRSLKVEALYAKALMNREKTTLTVFDYIEVFYNRQRSHSALNYLSPREYELAHANL